MVCVAQVLSRLRSSHVFAVCARVFDGFQVMVLAQALVGLSRGW